MTTISKITTAITPLEEVDKINEIIDALGSNAGHDLFDNKWCDYIISDQSWLRADTFSWQDGTVYSNAYNHLVDDIDGKSATTETVNGTTVTYYLADDGHKIVLAANVSAIETVYSSTGIAWYYVLDTTNQRFKLPRTKFGFEGLRDSVGKYIQAGLPNITGNFNLINHNPDYHNYSGAFSKASSSGLPITGLTSGALWNEGWGTVTENFNASNSNSIYGNSSTVQPPATQMYLYFYVGEFSQSATAQTAGLNSELFNGKLDLDAGNATSTTVNGLITKTDATGKQTIDGWGIPNYSAGVSISSGYVATSNGFVMIRRGTGSAYVYLYVNGIQVDSNESNTSNEGGTLSAFVQKGATVTWTTTNITGTPTFYPLIGG